MGNKISPENTTVIDVLPEKKPSQKKNKKREREERKEDEEDRGGFMSGPSFLSEEYDYGQYTEFLDEWVEEPTGGPYRQTGVHRRNAIHPHLLDIVQSQYQVQQQQHGCHTLSEQ